MRCATFKMTSVGFALVCLSGCLSFESGGSTEDCSFSLYDPMFSELPDRFALGTSYTAEIIGATEVATAESSNPEVIRLRRIDDEHAELSFIGEGTATITVSDGEDSTEHVVEVARHERTDVLLVELGLLSTAVVPIGGLSGKALVADLAQYFVVAYSDAQGALAGGGLADVTLPAEVVPCEVIIDAPLDLYCVLLDAPGPHLISVEVGDEAFTGLVGTVPEDQIESFVLLHDDESSLEPGDLVRVDGVGLAADGVLVHGLHPVFTSRGTSAGTDENYGENVGYFTYEYDPQAKPSRLDVRALDFSERLTFKGARLPPEVLSGCVASVWRKGGPVHGIVFLASLVLALRFRRRH